ncbi:MAG TPA: hypothetical protein VG713_01370, partial [Pirellulales bacterium]|nr:hypothetical protein [Pirellulales bacterium]
ASDVQIERRIRTKRRQVKQSPLWQLTASEGALVISSANLSERRTCKARTPFVALQIIPKRKAPRN